MHQARTMSERHRPLRGWLTAVLALLLMSAPPVMAPSAAHVGTVALTPASSASEASLQARALRRDVAAMLQRYIDDYGDRFSGAERGQLMSYRANADRHLAAVVVTTRRLDQVTSNGSSIATRRAAGAAAQSAWRRAKAASDSSFASARRIMEPRLSVIERLQALRDYTTMTGRFDELGVLIDEAAAAP